MHQIEGAGRGPVYDVDVMDFGTTQDESEADVPCSLSTCAEDGNFVHVFSAIEDERGGEGGAECGEFFGGKEGIWCA